MISLSGSRTSTVEEKPPTTPKLTSTLTDASDQERQHISFSAAVLTTFALYLGNVLYHLEWQYENIRPLDIF